jgi:DNA mismatch repair protein MutS
MILPLQKFYIQEKHDKLFQENFKTKAYSFRLDEWVFQKDFAIEKLNQQFGTLSLKRIWHIKNGLSIISAGAVLHYITTAEHHNTSHVSSIQRIEKGNHLWMDDFTISNLELIHSSNYNGHTLSKY